MWSEHFLLDLEVLTSGWLDVLEAEADVGGRVGQEQVKVVKVVGLHFHGTSEGGGSGSSVGGKVVFSRGV